MRKSARLGPSGTLRICITSWWVSLVKASFLNSTNVQPLLKGILKGIAMPYAMAGEIDGKLSRNRIFLAVINRSSRLVATALASSSPTVSRSVQGEIP